MISDTFHLFYVQLQHNYFEQGSLLQITSVFYTANINKFWSMTYSGHKVYSRATRSASNVTGTRKKKRRKISNFNTLKEMDTLSKTIMQWSFIDSCFFSLGYGGNLLIE